MSLAGLDRRITIEVNTPTPDAYGQPVDSWGTFATIWAKKRDIRGDEYFAAQQMNAKVDSVFTIRHLSGLLNTMRISYDSKYWDIRSINELGRNEGMEIYAEVKRS
jgi:SPP1 family predicted phage head-tail adaptor